MTSDFVDGDEGSEAGPVRPRLTWEVPEIAGVALLVVTAVLATSGLASGIARGFSFPNNGFGEPDMQLIWNAVQFGAQWASPVLAVFLLGTLGLCWYQLQVWSELVEPPGNDDDDEDVSDALGHIARAQTMAKWALIALGLTAAGSLAGFIADVGSTVGQPDSVAVTDIYAGGSTVVVFFVLTVGIWVNKQLGRRAAPAPLSNP